MGVHTCCNIYIYIYLYIDIDIDIYIYIYIYICIDRWLAVNWPCPGTTSARFSQPTRWTTKVSVPQILEGNVTKSTAHKALKSISSGLVEV